MYRKTCQKSSDIKYDRFSEKGFSLIEIILVVAIISIMVSMVISRGDGLSDKIDLENTAMSIDAKIKLAKSRSVSALEGKKHSLHFEANRVIVFQDEVYVDGASENEIFVFSDKIEINSINLDGSGDDLVFERLTGKTDNFGTIDIRVISDPSRSRQIVINADGQSSLRSFQVSSGSPIQNGRHVHFELGWDIDSAETLHLRWVDNLENQIAMKDITIDPFFDDSDKSFDWEGTTMVDSIEQKIKIHGWEESDNTVLCIMRENTEQEKLYIYTDDIPFKKDIATYENDGAQIIVSVDSDGGIMTIK